MYELDRRQLDQLACLGDRLQRERVVDTFLYVPTKESVNPAVALLEAAGLTVAEVLPPEGDEDRRFAILASKSMALMDGDVVAMRGELEGIAQQVGGMFDGWGCNPVLEADPQPGSPSKAPFS